LHGAERERRNHKRLLAAAEGWVILAGIMGRLEGNTTLPTKKRRKLQWTALPIVTYASSFPCASVTETAKPRDSGSLASSAAILAAWASPLPSWGSPRRLHP
jgi:hypothetical protein